MKKNAKLMLALCLLAVVLTSGVFSTFGATPPEGSSASLSPSGQHTPSPSDVSASSLVTEAAPLDESAPLDEDTPPAEDIPPDADAGNGITTLMAQTGPQIEPVIAIANPTEDPSPVLIFNSPIAGSIRFEGAWSASMTTVAQGQNMVEFEPMVNGYYENCSLTITGFDGQTLHWVHPAFAIQAPDKSGNLWGHLRTAGYDYDSRVLSNPAEAAWLATHHDMIIGDVAIEVGYDAMRAANPNVILIGYISMQVGPEKWLENWAASNGYDPEDLYYHYYYDTEVQLTQNRKITVPGWGGGSATSRREARAVIIYGGYSPMCPTSPVFVEAYTAYAMHLMTVNASKDKYIDGLFIDGYDLISHHYNLQRTVEIINKYGEMDVETANTYLGRDIVAMRNHMEMYTSAYIGRDIHIMGGAAEADYPNDSSAYLFANMYDNTNNEVSIEYLTKPIRTRHHDIKALVGLYDNMEAGVLVMANSETAWPTRFRNPDDPNDDWSQETWDNYNQHVMAVQYLIGHKNGYFAYHAGSASYYGRGQDGTLRQTHWHINYEFDIGKPVARAGADYWGKTGTDRFYSMDALYIPGQGHQYEVVAREYEYALVIAKFGVDSYPQVGRAPLTHNLGGSYRRLLADNTLGPIITQITLGQGEGAILIKLDENGNPLCDATIAPPASTDNGGGAAAAPSSSSKTYSGKPSSSSTSSSSSSAAIIAEITSSSSQPAPSAYSSLEIVNPTPTTPLTEAPEQIKVWMLVLAITGIVLVIFLLVLLISRLAAKRRQN